MCYLCSPDLVMMLLNLVMVLLVDVDDAVESKVNVD